MDESWIQQMAHASAGRPDPAIGGGIVTLAVGKTKSVTFVIDGGQVRSVGHDDSELLPSVRVPLKGAQVDSLLSGSQSLAQSFIRGDIKPVGATGALVGLVELFEDEQFMTEFSGLVQGH